MKIYLSILEVQSLNKIVILIITFLFIQNFSIAQECSTPNIEPQEAMNLPWFGNPAYLPSFMDSVRRVDGIPSASSRIVPSVTWRIAAV